MICDVIFFIFSQNYKEFFLNMKNHEYRHTFKIFDLEIERLKISFAHSILFVTTGISKHAEGFLNKIVKTFNKIYPGSNINLQRFRIHIYFFQNPT